MIGLYIHIPFCNKICIYCDFAKRIPKDNLMVDNYIDALIKEINSYKSSFNNIDTIYIGGGTPSVLNEGQTEKLLKALIDIKPIEFTIEVNPESYTHEKGLLYKKYGVNRVSLGVQTFNEKLLKFINREHKNEDVFNVYNDLINLGINNISIDLIFSLPNQTIKDLEDDLKIIKDLKPKHISSYALILEENTVLAKLVNDKIIKLNDEDLEANMFEIVLKTLKKYGYNHYEISNFSLPGFESIHNLKYWELKPYIGVGCGAHGFINNIRTINNKHVSEYIKNPRQAEIIQTNDDLLQDELIFGLRKTSGINIKKLEEKYQIKLFEKYPNLKTYLNDLIIIENDYLKFTYKGLFLENVVLREFI